MANQRANKERDERIYFTTTAVMGQKSRRMDCPLLNKQNVIDLVDVMENRLLPKLKNILTRHNSKEVIILVAQNAVWDADKELKERKAAQRRPDQETGQ